MNIKVISAICVTFLLNGCVNQKELDQKLKNEYMMLSCEQLNEKVNYYQKLKDENAQRKATLGTVSAVLNVISLISGHGTVATGDDSPDYAEMEWDRQIRILNEVMGEKKCNLVADFLEKRLDEGDPADDLIDQSKKNGLPADPLKEDMNVGGIKDDLGTDLSK